MIEPRLASGVIISAIKRLTEAQGDFATVLKKGDASSGAILLIGQIRGRDPILYERYASLTGQSSWKSIELAQGDPRALQEFWQKRTSGDPDLWVLELDVVSDARLNGLLNAIN